VITFAGVWAIITLLFFTDFVTILHAATITLSHISTPYIIIDLAPIKQSLPMFILPSRSVLSVRTLLLLLSYGINSTLPDIVVLLSILIMFGSLMVTLEQIMIDPGPFLFK